MNNRNHFYCLLLMLACGSARAQDQAKDTLSGIDTVYTLDMDTLRSNAGMQFYVGQYLVVGKGSYTEKKWYRTIGFRNATAWPLLLFHDMDMKNDYQYQSDGEAARDCDKVLQSVDSGMTAVITKIKRKGGPRHGFSYQLILKIKGSPGLRFRCDIAAAIRCKEILPPKHVMLSP